MMRASIGILLLFLSSFTLLGQTTFINEVSYLPPTICLEIATPAGTDLSDWEIFLYNELGEVVDSQAVTGVTGTVLNGLEFIIVDVVISMTEDSGLCLVDDTGQVVQFIGLGSPILAVDGPAVGLIAENINAQTSIISSLQLEGSGKLYPDFTWTEDTISCGLPNLNQTIEDVLQVLPIELTFLRGQSEGSSIIIEWQTLTEINNDYFILEHSSDGKNWQLLENVNSAGDSEIAQNYQVLDKTPFVGENYYRLSQVDLDGSIESFDIIIVYSYTNQQNLTIYPNPGNADILNIRSSKKENYEVLEIQIHDILGKVMPVQQLSNGAIDVSMLTPGTYFVYITNSIEKTMLIYIRSDKGK